jgi:hypothetical protein
MGDAAARQYLAANPLQHAVAGSPATPVSRAATVCVAGSCAVAAPTGGSCGGKAKGCRHSHKHGFHLFHKRRCR